MVSSVFKCVSVSSDIWIQMHVLRPMARGYVSSRNDIFNFSLLFLELCKLQCFYLLIIFEIVVFGL